MLTPGRAAHGGRYLESFEIAGPARVVYLSGQTPVRPDGTLPEGFEAQCRQAWANVAEVLATHGMSFGDLVKVTTFLADRKYGEENGRIRSELLSPHRPALTVIVAGIYDESWLVEIEAVAARPSL